VTDIQAGQILLLVTTAGGFIAQAWREARNRKWAIADRRAELDAQTAKIIAEAKARADVLLIETEAKAKVFHLEQLTHAEEIRTRLDVHDAWERDERDAMTRSAERLSVSVEEAKTAAQSAYTEANNVNVKIADLNNRLLREEQHKVS